MASPDGVDEADGDDPAHAASIHSPVEGRVNRRMDGLPPWFCGAIWHPHLRHPEAPAQGVASTTVRRCRTESRRKILALSRLLIELVTPAASAEPVCLALAVAIQQWVQV
ncbi:hypothetical protein NZK33_16760 [Cyanobium sp. FGCU-6]|nr:hypothetical protein [Cyanobium sp. FGCU6]